MNNLAFFEFFTNINGPKEWTFDLGTIPILRNQKDWVGGFGQMIMFDYGLGGWVWQDDYVIMAMKKNAISQKR